jgi:hypothetical protein
VSNVVPPAATNASKICREASGPAPWPAGERSQQMHLDLAVADSADLDDAEARAPARSHQRGPAIRPRPLPGPARPRRPSLVPSSLTRSAALRSSFAGHVGVATLYAWYDQQAGQPRCRCVRSTRKASPSAGPTSARKKPLTWGSCSEVAVGLGDVFRRDLARSPPRFLPSEGFGYLSGHPVAQAPPRQARSGCLPVCDGDPPGFGIPEPPGPGQAARPPEAPSGCRVGDPVRRRRFIVLVAPGGHRRPLARAPASS